MTEALSATISITPEEPWTYETKQTDRHQHIEAVGINMDCIMGSSCAGNGDAGMKGCKEQLTQRKMRDSTERDYSK